VGYILIYLAELLFLLRAYEGIREKVLLRIDLDQVEAVSVLEWQASPL
jgi:hypothetical protein